MDRELQYVSQAQLALMQTEIFKFPGLSDRIIFFYSARSTPASSASSRKRKAACAAQASVQPASIASAPVASAASLTIDLLSTDGASKSQSSMLPSDRSSTLRSAARLESKTTMQAPLAHSLHSSSTISAFASASISRDIPQKQRATTKARVNITEEMAAHHSQKQCQARECKCIGAALGAAVMIFCNCCGDGTHLQCLQSVMDIETGDEYDCNSCVQDRKLFVRNRRRAISTPAIGGTAYPTRFHRSFSSSAGPKSCRASSPPSVASFHLPISSNVAPFDSLEILRQPARPLFESFACASVPADRLGISDVSRHDFHLSLEYVRAHITKLSASALKKASLKLPLYWQSSDQERAHARTLLANAMHQKNMEFSDVQVFPYLDCTAASNAPDLFENQMTRLDSLSCAIFKISKIFSSQGYYGNVVVQYDDRQVIFLLFINISVFACRW